MKRLFIIAGCNGAGKTTASYTILPEILNCNEFVNADEIAKGLSPFQPEKVGIESGRLMLSRINSLLEKGEDFAFETTLSSKSYKNLILKAQKLGYHVTLLFFYLETPELAIERVKKRVSEGGHNIPKEVIVRRYNGGLKNFFDIYFDIVDDWIFANTSEDQSQIIASNLNGQLQIYHPSLWTRISQ